MKKIISIFLSIIVIITLVGCSDKKFADNRLNVIFYTANTGATQIDPIMDLEPYSKVEKPDDPVRAGFTFQGWFSDISKTILWNFENDDIGESSLVLYAKWVAETYYITYVLNGGVMPNTSYPTSFVYNAKLSLPTPTKVGHSFLAWYLYEWIDESSTKPGDAGWKAVPSHMTEDITLHAHWRINSITVTFAVNYPESEGAPSLSVSTRVIKYGADINFEVVSDTDDYKFLGWNSKSDGTGEWFINGEPFLKEARTSLYAIWEAK